MPDGHLHAVVDAIAAAGSKQLARRAADGAPVPFDLVELPATGGGAPLFSYRPRTRDFVEEHVDALRQLAQWPTAVNVLAGYDGLGDYLLARNERHVPIDARLRADAVLRVLLAEMHQDTGDFTYTPARAKTASDALSRCLLAGRIEGTVVVPLLGVRLEGERLELEDGLALVRDDAVSGLPREARSPITGRPGTVVVVQSLEDPSQTAMIAGARPRLRNLLSALRLYTDAAPALAPVAWSRVRGDGWASHPFIGTCARATGTLHIPESDGDSIRAFCTLLGETKPAAGSAPWALRRFELACERADQGEALTDVLLALRAMMLTDNPPAGMLGARVAALCAVPGQWGALRSTVELAEALELGLIGGVPTEPKQVREVTMELRGHLRALLRDMACGHLSGDLVALSELHLVRAFDSVHPDVVVPEPIEFAPIDPPPLSASEPVHAVAIGAEPAGEPAHAEPIAASAPESVTQLSGLAAEARALAAQAAALAARQVAAADALVPVDEPLPIADEVPAGEHEVKVEDYRAKPTSRTQSSLEPLETGGSFGEDDESLDDGLDLPFETDELIEASRGAVVEDEAAEELGADEPVEISSFFDAMREPENALDFDDENQPALDYDVPREPTAELKPFAGPADDPRAIGRTGKSFEEEFINSFTEGPAAHQPRRKRRVSSQSSRPRTRAQRRFL